MVFSILLLFIGCTKTGDKYMYDRQVNPFHSNGYHTKGEADLNTLQNGENPMKRPSYDEYQNSINPPLYDGK
jgi:hypothetical protein